MFRYIKVALKIVFGDNILSLFSNFTYLGAGLTKVPNNSNSTLSDLFMWRKDLEWSSYFELLDINYLISPEIKSQIDKFATLVFFNHSGEWVYQTEINYSANGRNTIDITKILPDHINGYGTFACFHLGQVNLFKEAGSFIADRGYCGFTRNASEVKSYVHGNLDAIAFDGKELEMLGNYNVRNYEYLLQYEFECGINYEVILTNPTNKKQKINLRFENHDQLDEKLSIEVRGSYVKRIFFEEDKKVRLVVESHMFMARPIIFRFHELSLDVFHG
jgi:hypothetical protein